MSKPIYSVLHARLLTEKTASASDAHGGSGLYVFRVDVKASKPQVAKAVEDYYGVKVAGVNTILIRGKIKRRGAKEYKRANYKKAVVKLVEGQKIKAFEEA